MLVCCRSLIFNDFCRRFGVDLGAQKGAKMEPKRSPKRSKIEAKIQHDKKNALGTVLDQSWASFGSFSDPSWAEKPLKFVGF